jgi:hypothetical protein
MADMTSTIRIQHNTVQYLTMICHCTQQGKYSLTVDGSDGYLDDEDLNKIK